MIKSGAAAVAAGFSLRRTCRRLKPAATALIPSTWQLIVVALAVNALCLPYLGFYHDARFYAAQTLHSAGQGLLDQDIYLKYGSQDRFTIFSKVMAPLTHMLGLESAFLLGYLASKLLFFWAIVRLVRALVPDRAAAALGVLFFAMVPVPFGGNLIFEVNESFLTPRIAASAFVLFALERVFMGRAFTALGLLAVALALSPLMALGGLLTWLGYQGWTWLGPKRLAIVTGLLGCVAVVVLLVEPIGYRLFGFMDNEWRGLHFQNCFLVKPGEWTRADWLRITWAFVVTGVAAFTFARSASRLLLAVIAAGVVGLIGSIIAVQTHYLLLIQASPYRALWLTEFLAVPLSVAWAFDLWRRNSSASRAAALLVLLLATFDWSLPFATAVVLSAFVAPFVCAAIALRGMDRLPHRSDWLGRSALISFVVGVALLAICDVVMLAAYCVLNADAHPLVLLETLPGLLYKLPYLAIVSGIVWIASRRLRWSICVAVGYPLILFGVGHSQWYLSNFSEEYRRQRFVAAQVKEIVGPERTATIYWPIELRQIWYGVGARSYFNWVQLSGNAYNRGTAIEGKRRALLTRRFEIAALKKEAKSHSFWPTLFGLAYGSWEQEGPPTIDDLAALCADPELDVIIVEQKFDGLYAATDGRFYVYDCRRVQRQLADAVR